LLNESKKSVALLTSTGWHFDVKVQLSTAAGSGVLKSAVVAAMLDIAAIIERDGTPNGCSGK
jgi:hypothetical protein